MKKHLIYCGLLAVVLSVASGCSTSTAQKLNRLNLGMSPAQVRNVLGNNYVAAASMTDANGSRLQLWEYTDKKTQEVYRVYFKDDELARWGTGRMDFPELNLPK